MPEAGLRAYLGSFTSEGGEGITTAEVDPGTGALTPVHRTAALADPSFLTLDPGTGLLYAVSEQDEGAAAAFRIGADGAPAMAGEPVPVGGSGPTHLAVASGQLLTANYVSGSVSVLPRHPDGTLTGAAVVLRHRGAGPVADRQDGPHAHQVQPDPSGAWVVTVDLGTDSVRVCRLAPGTGALSVHGEARMRPGSGPRHLAFHPRGELAYLVNELEPTLTVCRWDAARGELTPLGETPLLPADAEGGTRYASGIVVAPDGRFVWTATRGVDVLSTFALDDSGTAPELAGTTPCGGDWPRDLAVDPQGSHLYAANQRSGDVTWFTVDEATGLPSRGGSVAVPAASCVVFG